MSATLPQIRKSLNVPTSLPRHDVPLLWVGGYFELRLANGVYRLYSATHRKSLPIDREVYLEDVRFPYPKDKNRYRQVTGRLRARKPGSTDVALSHRMVYANGGGPSQRGFWAFDPAQAGPCGYRPKKAEGLVIRGTDLRVFNPSAERY